MEPMLYEGEGMPSSSHPDAGALTGRWVRESTDECAERYPAEVTFNPGTTYLGTRGADQGRDPNPIFRTTW